MDENSGSSILPNLKIHSLESMVDFIHVYHGKSYCHIIKIFLDLFQDIYKMWQTAHQAVCYAYHYISHIHFVMKRVIVIIKHALAIKSCLRQSHAKLLRFFFCIVCYKMHLFLYFSIHVFFKKILKLIDNLLIFA